MKKEDAIQFIRNTCGDGWITLVEILYDNCPKNIAIESIYQKWAGLQIDCSGEDSTYDELREAIYIVSQSMCEKCGKSAQKVIIDEWEYTLCQVHFQNFNTSN